MNKKNLVMLFMVVCFTYSCVEPEEVVQNCDSTTQNCESSQSGDLTGEYFKCQGRVPGFASMCSGDNTGLSNDTQNKLVSMCTAQSKCEFTCNTDYEMNATGSSCIEIVTPVTTPPATDDDDGGHSVAVKNYLQINNTYSSLTGIPTDFKDQGKNVDIKATFDAIVMQLPSSSNPESLNGFNQIAQARLGFAYCDAYMNKNYNSQYASLTNSQIAQKLLDSFLDVDPVANTAHMDFKNEVLAILNNSDSLLSTNDKQRLSKMACGAILASAYVTLI
ncbi:MAG: hypothetical protein CME62_17020 [Halobacteriovoraceae bacterium]|nr:hypothetical protein [Halobacteriovoraceae bacterium]|tara:strand:- start:19849 stop:20676 length:828 start_codon:yes stop_codon:yes gene_type:complete